MNKGDSLCSSCNKKCSSFDSRLVDKQNPSVRIHNRCLLRKKPAAQTEISNETTKLEISESKPRISHLKFKEQRERLSRRELINKLALEKQLNEEKEKLITQKSSGQYFFDLEKGVARPHEKKQYLSYRQTFNPGQETHDDSGFKIESSSRAFDHRGKNLFDQANSSSNSESGSEDGFISIKKRTSASNVYNTEPEDLNISPRNQNKCRDYMKKGEKNLKHQVHQLKDNRNESVRYHEHQSCWFCLSEEQCEKHLVVSVGHYCYLALDKGGITDNHMLILPIDHIRSMNDVENNKILQEVEKFKSALCSYYCTLDRKTCIVFFERNFRSSHFQIHAIPLTGENIRIDSLEKSIKDISLQIYPHGKFLPISESGLNDTIPRGNPYFSWHLEPLGVKFVMPINMRANQFFPMQFGRQVLCHEKLMNSPDKIDWKACIVNRNFGVKEFVIKLRHEFLELTEE